MTHHMVQPIPFPPSNARITRTKPSPRLRGIRVEVTPPELLPRATPAWKALVQWLNGLGGLGGLDDLTDSVQPRRDRLGRARTDFVMALADVADMGDTAAQDLQTRIRHARSLRELWHLRTELFSIVARRFNQAEAERRLGVLNAHFPTRAPKTESARSA